MSIRLRKQFKKFEQEFEKQQAQERFEAETPIRKAVIENEELMRQIHGTEKQIAKQELFTKANAVLAKCKKFVPDGTTREQQVAAIHDAAAQLRLELGEQGITLNESAMPIFGRLLEANRTLDSRDITVWRAMYELLDSLDMFTAHDRTAIEKPVEQVTEQTPVDFDEAIEHQEKTTREGAKKARELLAEALYGPDGEDTKIWQEWISSLANNFNFYPTSAQQRRAIDVFCEQNLSFHCGAHYDRVRRFLGSRGEWPVLQTPEEAFETEAEEWRTQNPKASDYEMRQYYSRRQRELFAAR